MVWQIQGDGTDHKNVTAGDTRPGKWYDTVQIFDTESPLLAPDPLVTEMKQA